MKTNFLKLGIVVMMFVLISSLTMAFTGSGAGTSGDPYIITTPSQLDEMRNDLTAYYELGNDIDLSGFGFWTPVASYLGGYWDGAFDGNGYTISGLSIQATNTGGNGYASFFGTVGSPIYIRNVTFDSPSITEHPTDDLSSECCAGVLFGGQDIGAVDFTIEYVKIDNANINLPNLGGTSAGCVGGFACYVANGNTVIVRDSYFDGTIVGTDSLAGIFSDGRNVDIDRVYTSGSMTVNSVPLASVNDDFGGILGSFSGTITDSYSTMDLTYNLGSSTTNILSGVGGIVEGKGTGTLTNVFYSGNINYVNEGYGGTLPISGNIYYNNSLGKTITYDMTCSNVYYNNDANIYSNDASCNNPLTTAQMTQQSSFIGFDFANTWTMGVSNPELQTFITNTAPVINSISPNTYVELTNGETQVYTSDVTDADGDATYSWTLDGAEVSTSSSYIADYDNIQAGIYTLTLTVDDGVFSDSASVTLERRALGGSPSGGASPTTTNTVSEPESDSDFSLSVTGETSGSDRTFGEVISDFFARIGSFFRNLVG